ncbi:MAG: M20/M25/M40 family metallo-hydrolase [Gemmatimonadetes bacterium]|nr:M20/M25/M40 family metallo-hydrolase [Gemmatimonadota bacterium]
MTDTISALSRHPALTRGHERLIRTDARTVAWQTAICETPAPTGREQARGAKVSGLLREIGLTSVSTDDVGNVIAWWGPADRAPVVIAAHLDTVFGPGVDVSVRKDGDRLIGPGITDNARGLAGMLALADVVASGQWATAKPIAFVATVGEEGAGDLRGVRHLFGERKLAADSVIVLDGAGDDRVVHGGLGCRRYRFMFRGPGGHSWSAFGAPNPAHAASTLTQAVAELPGRETPRTTCSVVGIGGGTSLNSIPDEAWVEIDLRSEGTAPLEEIERVLHAAARLGMDRENARKTLGSRALDLTVAVIGDRPSGVTPADHPLVQAGLDATRAVGRRPALATASTDANIPISLGIPAIALGAGGKAGDTHSATEWFENADGPAGIFRALLVLAAAAGLNK